MRQDKKSGQSSHRKTGH